MEERNSTAMFYYDHGRGPLLLLIHGMFGDHLDWEPILELLAGSYRVIAVDLPGFGASEKPDTEYTAEFFCQNLVKLLDDLGIHQVSVVGNSFGGQIAMALALQYPERVQKLVLITTGGLHEYTEPEIQAALQRLSQENLLRLTPEMYWSMFGRIFQRQGTELQRRYIEKQIAKLARPDYPDYVRSLHRSMRLSLNLCLLPCVPSLKCPVLLLHGEHDPVVLVSWIRAALPSFPDAQLSVMPDCAHIPQLEKPAQVAAEIGSFLS